MWGRRVLLWRVEKKVSIYIMAVEDTKFRCLAITVVSTYHCWVQRQCKFPSHRRTLLVLNAHRQCRQYRRHHCEPWRVPHWIRSCFHNYWCCQHGKLHQQSYFWTYNRMDKKRQVLQKWKLMADEKSQMLWWTSALTCCDGSCDVFEQLDGVVSVKLWWSVVSIMLAISVDVNRDYSGASKVSLHVCMASTNIHCNFKYLFTANMWWRSDVCICEFCRFAGLSLETNCNFILFLVFVGLIGPTSEWRSSF